MIYFKDDNTAHYIPRCSLLRIKSQMICVANESLYSVFIEPYHGFVFQKLKFLKILFEALKNFIFLE